MGLRIRTVGPLNSRNRSIIDVSIGMELSSKFVSVLGGFS